MAAFDAAKQVLDDAEESMRSLVANAAAAGKYDMVVVLTDWARQLSVMAASSTIPLQQSAVPAHQVNGQVASKKESDSAAQSRRRKYPKFFRSGKWLIKVAWSKSLKAEYEHRAPIVVVHQLTDAMTKASSANPLVTMDEIFPLMSSEGDEVPSYQSYLCLAWLKDVGFIRKHGRKGYSLKPNIELNRDAATAWNQLPSRR